MCIRKDRKVAFSSCVMLRAASRLAAVPAAPGARALSAYACTAARAEGRSPSPLLKPSDIKGGDPHSKVGKEFKGAVN